MRSYYIILENVKTNSIFHRATFNAHTFAEAAREAYKIRVEKGFDWRIKSVISDDKCTG